MDGSHICIVKTVGDLRKVLAPFADNCDITKVRVEYSFTGDIGFVHIARATEAKEPEVCPHYFKATDGVHVVLVGRCNCDGKPEKGAG